MSKKSRRNNIRSHSLQTNILFWWTRSSRTPGTKSSTSYSWWKFSSEEIMLDWLQHEDPKFRAKKFRTLFIRVATRAWISKTTILKANQWADQSQRERIHLCSRLGIKGHLHKESYGRSCQEFEELKRRCYQEEKTKKNNEDWKNFLHCMIRNHEQWVYSSTILTYWAVMTNLRSSSSSHYLEFKKA